MNRLAWLLFFGSCALWAEGCQTVERVNGIEYPVSDEPKEDEREQALLALLEEDEKNLSAWFRLGEHYERGLRYRDAYAAFANFQRRLDWEEDRTRVPKNQRATLGWDALGRLALRLGAIDAARDHYLALLDRQPASARQARLNPHFVLAHLRLGEIYFSRETYDKAYLHVMIHRELGGTEGDGILIKIEEHKQAEARRAQERKAAEKPVQPSLEPEQGSEAQPAGSRK